MSLLRDLWGNPCGKGGDGDSDGGRGVGGKGAGGDGSGSVPGGVGGDKAAPSLASRDSSLRDPEMSYAQAVSSSSSGDRIQVKTTTSKSLKCGGIKLVGTNHPRSPRSSTCGRCFRTSHSTAECRHQVVCLRCSCVGHLTARCPVEIRHSPCRKRLHV